MADRFDFWRRQSAEDGVPHIVSRLTMRTILARLDAAEEVCEAVWELSGYLDLSKPLDDSLAAWRSLREGGT